MRLESGGMDQITGTVVADPMGQTSFEEFFGEHREALFRALWLLTRDSHEAEEIAREGSTS
jgi:DNA-directed RNA polymerase specialized sigma24 family protein